MTLTQLDYFLALAAHRSFSQAAKACGVTQPTLSAQFQKLEEELGHALIDRKTQPMALTPLGEALREQAQRTVESAQAIHTLIDQFDHPVVGHLRLGVVAPLGTIHGAFWLNQWQQSCPHATVHLEEGTVMSLAQKLARAELDAAIVPTEEWNAPGKLKPVFGEAWWAMAPQVGGQAPSLADVNAWLFGPPEEAATLYAARHGWKRDGRQADTWPTLFGRVLLAERSRQWVLLSESELSLLPAETQKRAQPWGDQRTWAWVSRHMGGSSDLESRLCAALQTRLPVSLHAIS